MKKTLILASLILILALAACSTTPQPAPADAPEADPANTALISQGKTVFQANCSACHTTASKDVLVGPSMIGLASRAWGMVDGLNAIGYVEQSILEPAAFLNEDFQNLMPATYSNSLSNEEMDALVEYLMTFE